MGKQIGTGGFPAIDDPNGEDGGEGVQEQFREPRGCPFCGAQPMLTQRPCTPGERHPHRRYVAFLACMCGGYSARAHQAGFGNSKTEAFANVTAAWNSRAES